MLGVKMFSRKSGLVPGFTAILKCTPECDGIVALHTDGKALQEEISFTLISGDRRNATSQLREKLCTLSIYRPKCFEGNGDKHMSCRQQCIFGSLVNSSLLSCRTCRDCCLRQVCCSTSVDHCGIPGHVSSSRPGNECGIGSQKTRWFLHAWNICTLQ